jgi:hypothetical protein
MKRVGFILVTAILSVSYLYSQETSPVNNNDKAPEITFLKMEHDFGKIKYSGDGSTEFEFKNTGKDPLVITNVKSSCGCTVPVWPKEPIEKGKKGTIKVNYDTKRQGKFQKTITVVSNASNPNVVLTIKGEVDQPSPEEMEQVRKEREEQAARRQAAMQKTQPQVPPAQPQQPVMPVKDKQLPENQ